MTKAGEVRIGTAGWNIPRESAAGFPSEGMHLERYAQVLNCAEINTSFYRPHRQLTWKRWRDSVPQDFRFAVKAPKAITHEAELQFEPDALKEFLGQVRFLGKNLGPLLFQLPPSLQFERRSVMKLLKLLREHFSGRAVFEPRHASWFSQEAHHLLSTFDIARVAADPACVPDAGQPGGFEQLVYFRLHGSPRRYYSSYSDAFLSNLADMLKQLRERADVWCVFDNTASGAAIRNALDLRRKMQSR